MSVLIKGMDMPTNCCNCKFCTRTEISQCTITGGFTNWEYYNDAKRDDCPLVDVPTPHGRLIDADELKLKKYHSCVAKENVVAVAHIDWSPTVIEAEE